MRKFLCVSVPKTIDPMYASFSTMHAMSNVNKIYKFQDILGIFTRIYAYKTERQTNQIHKRFSTLLERIDYSHKCLASAESNFNTLFKFSKLGLQCHRNLLK